MSDSTNPCCPPHCLPQPVTSPLDCVLMWVAVCRGATGVPGMNGIAGSNGFDGETGPQGPTRNVSTLPVLSILAHKS